MKTSDLSIKELAAVIGVSTGTIRRAVRKSEIPARRVRTALRFDPNEVLTCMLRNAEPKFGTRSTSVAQRRKVVNEGGERRAIQQSLAHLLRFEICGVALVA